MENSCSQNLRSLLDGECSSPLICLEVNPPRGVDLTHIYERLDDSIDGIDLLNVTDCALARMKFAALPFASLLKQRYQREVVVNLSCRDRNVVALQADLLAGWALGVRSIVALTGDAMTIGDMPDRKGVFELNSIGLLQLVETLNRGVDLAGNQLKGAPSYLPGVVFNPNVKNRGAEIRRLEKKRAAGALYALSQPVFDIEAASSFFKEASAVGVKLFVGLLPLKSKQAAHAVSSIPGIKMPESMLARLESLSDAAVADFFIEHSMEMAAQIKPYVRGFHVVSGGTPLLALKLASSLVKQYRG